MGMFVRWMSVDHSRGGKPCLNSLPFVPKTPCLAGSVKDPIVSCFRSCSWNCTGLECALIYLTRILCWVVLFEIGSHHEIQGDLKLIVELRLTWNLQTPSCLSLLWGYRHVWPHGPLGFFLGSVVAYLLFPVEFSLSSHKRFLSFISSQSTLFFIFILLFLILLSLF